MILWSIQKPFASEEQEQGSLTIMILQLLHLKINEIAEDERFRSRQLSVHVFQLWFEVASELRAFWFQCWREQAVLHTEGVGV